MRETEDLGIHDSPLDNLNNPDWIKNLFDPDKR